MKKIFALAALLMLSTCARGQQGNTTTLAFPGAPTGGCSFNMFAKNVSNGDLYSCGPAGSWVLVSSGGGGGGTVTSVGLGGPTGFTVSGSPVSSSGTLSFTMNAHGVASPLACADSSGSSTAQSCTTSPSFTPATGDAILYSTTTANTGDVTVNVNSTSAVHVRKWSATAVLVANDLAANVPVVLVYDGTYWEINTISNTPAPPPVNAAIVSRASTVIGSCTITLTNATNTATSSGTNCFSPLNVGAILQANLTGSAANCNAAVTALTPCFRATILSVVGNTITLGAYFPGTTTSGIAFNSGPAAGDYNLLADACGQMNAALLNYPSSVIDARGITGAQACTQNPWNGAAYTTLNGWANLLLGQVNLTITRPWYLPNNTEMTGLGKGQPGPPAQNTYIIADASNWAQTYEANAQASNTVTTTSGTATFQDAAATGSCGTLSASNNCSTEVQVVSTAACVGGTNFGVLTMLNPIYGWTESSQISVAGFTTNTGWNGQWMVTAVSGLSATIQFNVTCPTVGTITNTSCTTTCTNATAVPGSILVGSYQASTGNTYTSAAAWNNSAASPLPPYTFATSFVQATSSGSEFAATDVGSCVLSASGKAFTVVYNVSATVDVLGVTTNPTWSATGTRTCWVTSTLNALSSFNAGTQTAIYTSAEPMQQTCSGCSMTYTIGGPMVEVIAFTGNGSTQGTSLHDFSIDCNALVDCTALSINNQQEHGGIYNIDIAHYTAYGITADSGAAHGGPIRNMQIGAASNNTNTSPAGACVNYASPVSAAPLRGIESITCIANSNGVDPYVGYEIAGPATHAIGNHCERYGICFSVGRFPGQTNAKGIYLGADDAGIGVFESVKIWAGQVDVVVDSLLETNQASWEIDDKNVGPTCAAGTTYIQDGARAVPSVAHYWISNTNNGTPTNPVGNTGTGGFSNFVTRQTSDGSATNCFGGTSNAVQSLTLSSNTATAYMTNGNTVTLLLNANLTTLTINNAAAGQQMDLIIVENGTGGWTVALPSNFKNATAATTTANSCNAYHMVYDGTNWIQEGFTTGTNGGSSCL